MIKFFRKIRQRLLTENKFSRPVSPAGRYLIYAIGEIVLVVIGILIALQVNNWNQNRINNGKQQDYLIGLKNDLETQIYFFNDLDQFCDRIIDEGESILADFNSVKKFSEIESINRKLTTLMFTNSYPEIRTTFNELSSTGQLNLIKEKSLRSQIIKYYLTSEFYQSRIDANIENVIYPQIFPIIKSMIIIHPENFGFEGAKINLTDNIKTTFENNLNNSTKEFELVNAISLRIIISKSDKGAIESAKKDAELLLVQINNELNIN